MLLRSLLLFLIYTSSESKQHHVEDREPPPLNRLDKEIEYVRVAGERSRKRAKSVEYEYGPRDPFRPIEPDDTEEGKQGGSEWQQHWLDSLSTMVPLRPVEPEKPVYSGPTLNVHDDERDALQQLYIATNGTGWKVQTNWLEGKIFHCDWYGVQCNERGFVAKLLLSGNRLRGSIPGDLGELRSLERLELNRNELTGVVPTTIGNLKSLWKISIFDNHLRGPLPPEIAGLRSLEVLWLNNNDITGALPTAIGRLSNLTGLLLDDNELSGSLPTELGNLRSLTYLNLQRNMLWGSIPTEMGRLRSLEILDMSENALMDNPVPKLFRNLEKLHTLRLRSNAFAGPLTGIRSRLQNLMVLDLSLNSLNCPLPAELGMLRKLKQLYISNSFLSGSIPSHIGSSNNLEVIDFSYNNLTGSIPPHITNITSLRILDLQSNRMDGPLPDTWDTKSPIEELKLQNNSITGALPPELGLLTDLQIFHADNNVLQHHIPTSMANMMWLTSLSLANNFLTGSLPVEIGSLRNLEVLRLGNNYFTGEVPSSFGNMTALKYLFLERNSLNGTLPLEMKKLDSLVSINISNNSMLGELSTSINLPKNIQKIDFSANKFNGTLPLSLIKFSKLDELKLSNNRLSGTIFSEMGNILLLRFLYLDRNELTGTLPSDISLLTSLQQLDLSNNRFHYAGEDTGIVSKGLVGRIPVQLAELFSLKMLDLSGNLLTGDIPTELGKLMRIKELHLADNYLEGWIPSQFGDLKCVQQLRLKGNKRIETPAPLGTCNLDAFDLRREHSYCPPERRILSVFYNAAKGDQWKEKSGWLSEYQNHCSWHNVSCNRYGSIINLTLNDNALSGTITPEISHLSSMRFLQLRNNKLHGTIPHSLGSLTNLTAAYLYGNRFEESIPNFENFSSVSTTIICNSYLGFDLDAREDPFFCPERAFLTSLHRATVGENWTNKYLWTHSTSSVCDWHGVRCDNVSMSVTHINLKGNNMVGTIPPGVASLTSLLEMDLSGNKLIGSIPDGLWSLKELRVLNLSNNSITGNLPVFIGSATNLAILRVARNRLTGPVPPEVGAMTLRDLDLAHNDLTGEIPPFLADGRNVVNLFLRANRFSGIVSEGLCSLSGFDMKNHVAWCPSNVSYKSRTMKITAVCILILYIVLLVSIPIRYCKVRLCWKPRLPWRTLRSVIRRLRNAWQFFVSAIACLVPDLSRWHFWRWLEWWSGCQVPERSNGPPNQNNHVLLDQKWTIHMNLFASIAFLMQMLVAVISGYLAITEASVGISLALSGLFGWYLSLLSLVFSLLPDCSPWPYRLSMMLIPPAALLGFFNEQDAPADFFVFVGILYFAWCFPCYLAARVLRNVIIEEYGDRDFLAAVMNVVERFFFGLGPVLFFVLRGVQHFRLPVELENGLASTEKNHLKGWVSVFSGVVVLLTIMSNEVQRIAKLSIKDMITLQLTKWEFSALLWNMALVFLALYLETAVNTLQLIDAEAIICTLFVGPAVQLFCLWCVAWCVLRRENKFMKNRLGVETDFGCSILVSDKEATENEDNDEEGTMNERRTDENTEIIFDFIKNATTNNSAEQITPEESGKNVFPIDEETQGIEEKEQKDAETAMEKKTVAPEEKAVTWNDLRKLKEEMETSLKNLMDRHAEDMQTLSDKYEEEKRNMAREHQNDLTNIRYELSRRRNAAEAECDDAVISSSSIVAGHVVDNCHSQLSHSHGSNRCIMELNELGKMLSESPSIEGKTGVGNSGANAFSKRVGTLSPASCVAFGESRTVVPEAQSKTENARSKHRKLPGRNTTTQMPSLTTVHCAKDASPTRSGAQVSNRPLATAPTERTECSTAGKSVLHRGLPVVANVAPQTQDAPGPVVVSGSSSQTRRKPAVEQPRANNTPSTADLRGPRVRFASQTLLIKDDVYNVNGEVGVEKRPR